MPAAESETMELEGPQSTPAAPDGPALVAASFSELGAFERHLSGVQSRYRVMASGWLLATLLGSGWILTSPSFALGLHPLLLVTLAGVAGSVGLVLLWSLDLMVTSRQLDAVLIESLRLEQRHPALPSLHHNMMALYGGRGVLERVAAFYYAAVTTTGIIGGLAMVTWTAEVRSELTGWVVGAAVAVLALTLVSMRSSTGHTRQLLGNLARSTRAAQARREMETGL